MNRNRTLEAGDFKCARSHVTVLIFNLVKRLSKVGFKLCLSNYFVPHLNFTSRG